MSRHDLRPKLDAGIVTRGSVGWDRPLQTFFAQLFSINENREEEPHIWIGTFPRELASAAAAIAVVETDCVVPEGLGAALETERLASLGTFDGPQQVDLKSRFLRRPPSDAGD
jgi:hypothetical protein